MKLIGAISVYNGADFIGETLESLLQIKDLNAVHILDGSWQKGGETLFSTDGTVENIKEFAATTLLPFELIYERPDPSKVHLPFRTQSEKRNYQLKRIEEFNKAHGDDDYYVFVIDADEVVQFPNGLKSIWLKEGLEQYYPKVGLLTTYAHGSSEPLVGGRFLPGKVGVHYHTERAMVIHDASCQVLNDYNPESRLETYCWTFDKFFLVNNYARRNKEALDRKARYYEYKKALEAKGEDCKYARPT